MSKVSLQRMIVSIELEHIPRGDDAQNKLREEYQHRRMHSLKHFDELSLKLELINALNDDLLLIRAKDLRAGKIIPEEYI